MSGFDARLTLHLQESEHAAALKDVGTAREALEAMGFTVTQGPTLSHSPLGGPEDVEALMGDDS